MRGVLMILVFLVMLGCGKETPTGENVPLDKIPEPVMKVAKEKLPEVKFEQAWKTAAGNFEVRGKAKNGKVRDIQIKPNGDVIEVD